MKSALSFQDLIAGLQAYWCSNGCLAWLPYHETVGAGTYNSATALRVLGPEPWNVAYVEPSFRPDDGRFGENPNRVQMHHQFQVILQPAPVNPLEKYLASLEALGLNLADHDVRFVEDNWESPALGAWGLGWEVWLDGMEITQFTYFQQAGGLVLESPAVEITYGLERIAMYLQGVKSIWEINWDGKQSYGEILRQQEIEFCEYDFNVADIGNLKDLYLKYVAEANLCLSRDLVIPAHDYVLKCSHTFNLLDARGAIGLAERVKYFAQMRGLARAVAEKFYKQRRDLGFPLLKYIPEWPAQVLPVPGHHSETPETLVIELGVEELAASMPEPLVDQLKEGVVRVLAEANLTHGIAKAFATPRRLSLVVESVQPIQDDRTVTVKGPAKSVCEKNPKALEGFCRKNSISLASVGFQEIEGQEYAVAEVQLEGRSAIEVLGEKLPEVISSLRAAQSMRWLSASQVGEEAASITFNRPVRWIVALLGNDVIPFAFASVCSNRVSYGGRWERSPALEISGARSYLDTLAARNITVDHNERKEIIREQVKNIAAKNGYTAHISEAILDEVTQLVEYPTAFLGRFDARFKVLPRVVLEVTMEKHLRFFPALDSQGTISAFIGVRNGGFESIELVREGNERVLDARYSDAEFFYNRDKAKSLEDFRERIKTLNFVEKLGSFFDKTERLKELIICVAAQMPTKSSSLEELQRAAILSKADLGSQMVIEMSALQGKMGRLYAELSNESSAVALAIEEQYLPRFARDKIPESPLGVLLSITDKVDTISALFSIGAEPTGSADPYAIRRETLGVLSIVLAKQLNLSFRELFSTSLRLLKAKDPEAVIDRMLDFMKRRLEVILRERGNRYDVIRAVLERIDDNPALAESLVKELEKIVGDSTNGAALMAYIRCVKLINHAVAQGLHVTNDVKTELFTTAAEKELWRSLTAAGKTNGISESFQKLMQVTVPINNFFDEVMVMDKDEAIRQNRLAVVGSVVALLDPFANFAMLEIG